MVRFVICGLAATVLVTFGAVAAPIPKDVERNAPPDLKSVLAAVNKVVRSEKWPAEVEEKLLREAARVVFERSIQAAGQKDRKLPVDFTNLKKMDVTAEFKSTSLDDAFLIAGDVQVDGDVHNSVIFASGNVKLVSATNCVVVGQNVNCNIIHNSLMVAQDFLRMLRARLGDEGEPGSVMVAGQWIRGNAAEKAICHVLRPGVNPPPKEKGVAAGTAIRLGRAKDVIFLNANKDANTGAEEGCTYSPPKVPIAK